MRTTLTFEAESFEDFAALNETIAFVAEKLKTGTPQPSADANTPSTPYLPVAAPTFSKTEAAQAVQALVKDSVAHKRKRRTKEEIERDNTEQKPSEPVEQAVVEQTVVEQPSAEDIESALSDTEEEPVKEIPQDEVKDEPPAVITPVVDNQDNSAELLAMLEGNIDTATPLEPVEDKYASWTRDACQDYIKTNITRLLGPATGTIFIRDMLINTNKKKLSELSDDDMRNSARNLDRAAAAK